MTIVDAIMRGIATETSKPLDGRAVRIVWDWERRCIMVLAATEEARDIAVGVMDELWGINPASMHVSPESEMVALITADDPGPHEYSRVNIRRRYIAEYGEDDSTRVRVAIRSLEEE